MESLLNILLLACLLGSGLVTCIVIVIGVMVGIQLLSGEENEKL
jgi:sorbitol-specific phosphotransferase system component IIBC